MHKFMSSVSVFFCVCIFCCCCFCFVLYLFLLFFLSRVFLLLLLLLLSWLLLLLLSWILFWILCLKRNDSVIVSTCSLKRRITCQLALISWNLWYSNFVALVLNVMFVARATLSFLPAVLRSLKHLRIKFLLTFLL